MLALRQPIYRVSDRMVVIGPIHHGKTGIVVEVYVFHGMHRYVIEFENGTTAVFFEFELDRLSPVRI